MSRQHDPLLHALVDGGLDAARATAVERLAEADPALGRRLADLRAVDARLRASLPVRAPDADLHARILDRLPAGRPAPRAVISALHLVLGASALAALAIAVAADPHGWRAAAAAAWLVAIAGVLLLIPARAAVGLADPPLLAWLRRPLATLPADPAVCRATGAIALLAGGIGLGARLWS